MHRFVARKLTAGAWLALISFVVGLVLACSGLLHLANNYDFLASVLAYRILPVSVAIPFAAAVPFLQLLIGVCLLANIWRGPAICLATMVLISFAFAQLSAFSRGLGIDCGCFGSFSAKISLITVTEVGLLAVLAITGCCLCYESSRKRNLDAGAGQ